MSMDDFSIPFQQKQSEPVDEFFLVPGANKKLDEIFNLSKQIHELLGVDFASREHLKIKGAEWQFKKYHGRQYIVPNRLALLEMHLVTENDLVQVDSELAQSFEKAVSDFISLMTKQKETERKLISFDVVDNVVISYAAGKEKSYAAGKEKMNFAQYVNWAAYSFAALNVFPPAGIERGCFTISQAVKCAKMGATLQQAFTPDEVKEAMDKAGISASQAVTLMAELERLRDARMNPEV